MSSPVAPNPIPPANADVVFPPTVAFVIDQLEGGDRLVVDAGGATRWGIAQKFHPGINVSTLTRDQAIAVYRSEYWDRLRCGEMPAAVGVLAFDMAVNPGPGLAVDLLQAELRVEVDGVVGPDTLDACRYAQRGELIAGLNARRIAHYYDVVRRDPDRGPYLDGWVRRSGRMLIWAARLL